MTGAFRTFTIPAEALKACPAHVLLAQHYRKDGTCLHVIRDREPVTFHAGFLDDGVREAYNGQKAVILGPVGSDEPEAPDYVIEFESGNRLQVFRNEVTPND